MAIRQIVKIGDEILRAKSKEVTVFDDRLSILLDDMIETMKNADGAGLAAPQVGILERVCVVSVDGGNTIYELVNPVILKATGLQRGNEGCLSVPNRSGLVDRPKRMLVEAYNRLGEKTKHKVTGYLAVAFSHEIDHLDGIIYTDKLVKDETNGA